MRQIAIALLLLFVVSLNALLGTRLMVGDKPIPPLGHFLSPQEGFWANALQADRSPKERVRLKGLGAAVQVTTDAWGIPHLFAANDTDLYRAQGYVVARERLWQMDMVARAAEGRLSEVMGAATVAYDRAQRRKGMTIGAQASTDVMLADTLMAPLLKAYADGVDQYIATLRYRDLPFEYKLLDHRPAEWSPYRSALVQQYMVDNLSGWDRDVEDTHARAALGETLFELLWPVRPPGVVPTVPTDSLWPFEPETVPVPPGYDPGSGYMADAYRSDPANGSNNWAVHGSRTANGRPLLANDPHLGLFFPSIWIPMQLTTPENRVFGFALPGGPGVVIGHNEHVAWGVTNAPRDTRDWYRITWKDSTRTAYLYDDKWLPVQWRVEEVRIRGERTLVDSIRMTVHGPVVYDERFGDAPHRSQLAFRWMGHEPNRALKALYLMNKARSHADHVHAMQWFEAPAQNWVFASTAGDISMRVQGRFPNKWEGQGRFVLDGADPAHRWQGFIPFAHTATQVNPARGFVSSANQHSVDEKYPYFFHNAYLEYYRNRTLNDALSEDKRFTVEDMMRLQHSGLDRQAAEGLAAFLPLIDTTTLDADGKHVYALLRDWDHVARHDGEERALYQRWRDAVDSLLWAPLRKVARQPLGLPVPYNTFRILADPELRNTVATGLNVDPVAAVREAFDAVAERRRTNGPELWRTLNNARVTHLSRVPALGREELPVDGAGTALNAQRGGHGPSMRMVVELTDPPQAWIQLPGGVSGDPASRHYDDLLPGWLTLDYIPVQFLRDAKEAREHGRHSMQLVP
jgi:penicillin amidase